jgi:hypothetical protein
MGTDHPRELLTDENCASRKHMNEYLDFIIQRYRNSPAVLTWELANEITLLADVNPDTKIYDGMRMPTLLDVRNFYDVVAKRIHQNDPLRIVNGGGTNMREPQWNMYKNNSFDLDTIDEQYKAMDLLYRNNTMDIIDIHYYTKKVPGYLIKGHDGKEYMETLQTYMDWAKKLNKPLLIGEMGVQPDSKIKGYFSDYSETEKALPYFKQRVDEIVNSGVQLTYWWAYSPEGGGSDDIGSCTLRASKHPEIMKLIIDGNKRLKEKYNAD